MKNWVGWTILVAVLVLFVIPTNSYPHWLREILSRFIAGNAATDAALAQGY
jgi:hypothetical protein